jgi:hypothetical protein
MHEKRILAIWDFQDVCYSIGELLYLQEITLVLQWIHQVNKTDIAFVCDPNPGPNCRHDMNSYILHHSLISLFPVAQMNPNLGSFYLFDSYAQLEKHIGDNAELYCCIWPSYTEYVNQERAYAHIFNFIQQFYIEHHFIPHLSCRPAMIDWAYAFYRENVYPSIPVVVQARNNPIDRERNIKIEQWLDFFQYFEKRLPVKFVVLCAQDEVDDRMRRYSNVLIAKDYHTNIVEELALIQSSAMYMGVPCGPSVMAIFSNLSYIIVNMKVIHDKVVRGTQYIFANDMQKIIWEPETTTMLIEEFVAIFNRIDINAWLSKCKGSLKDFDSPLRLR